MKCAWDAYLNLLPLWMRQSVNARVKDSLQELRLRRDHPPELITQNGSIWLERNVSRDDLTFCVNIASRYSPWSAATAAYGYITAPGGHRVGLCGQAVVTDRVMSGIREPTSVCIRVARDFPNIADAAADIPGSILILGKPGSGKTTLLRDLIRKKSEKYKVSVIDEREEIFPIAQNRFCFPTGKRTDVMTGCGKRHGIESVLRTMSPDYIAVDEITVAEDCAGLLHAGWCGVTLLGTAHAKNKMDLMNRPVYKPLVSSGLFDHLLILQPDKSWRLERMGVCC